MIRRVLSALLARLGHEVRSCEDRAGAKAALQEAGPLELAIVDQRLSGASAAAVIGDIRAQSPSTRIIGTSGAPRAADLPSIEGWLDKPYRLETLKALITSVMAD